MSDVGKALNPTQVRGQDEGAAIMGLGHTLMEQYIYDDTGGSGTSVRSTTGSRRAWTCRSRMESDIVENEDGPGPYGAKGMSEGALLPGRAGGRCRRPRRDRRRDPRPAAHAGARVAGAAGAASG